MQTTTISRKKTASAKRRPRAVLKRLIEALLREKFPRDTVDVSNGYEDNIHVVVVSKIFDKMNERAKTAYLSKILEGSDLTEAEMDLVTVLLAWSPRELK